MAADDLAGISEYLAERHPRYRQPTMKRLYEAIRSLRQTPMRGRAGSTPGTRELVLPPLPYVVVYRVTNSAIEVLRIYHGAQNR